MNFKNVNTFCFERAPFQLEQIRSSHCIEFKQQLVKVRNFFVFMTIISIFASLILAPPGIKAIASGSVPRSNDLYHLLLCAALWSTSIVVGYQSAGSVKARIEDEGLVGVWHKAPFGKEKLVHPMDPSKVSITLRRIDFQTPWQLEYTGFAVFVADGQKAFAIAVQLHTPRRDTFDLPVPQVSLPIADHREKRPVRVVGDVRRNLKRFAKKRLISSDSLWNTPDDSRHERGLENWLHQPTHASVNQTTTSADV